MRRLLGSIAVLLALLGAALPMPASAIDVIGDDAADAYAGSGGLLLPATVDDRDRERAATCQDCQWRLVSPCVANMTAGEQVYCQLAAVGCPRGAFRLRAWLREGAQAGWRDLGLVCVPSGGPVTVARVERELTERFERRLPETGIAATPPRGVLPYLPVVFDSGQPSVVPATTHQILGREVVLDPHPTWHWEFGDGATMTTDVPGSRYPDLAVSHAYRSGGTMLVRVTTVWTARFTVDGLGPFTVSDPVRQTAQMRIEVGQARAVLVP